jgi:uncharacterized protein involved in response to NO
LDKSPNGSIVTSFYIIRKKTGRELFHSPVVLQAFAADALSAAGLIRAVAEGQVFFLVAFFHAQLLSISEKFAQREE